MNFSHLQKDPVKYSVLLFLVGACARFDVNLVARFALSELLLIAYFPFALSNIKIHFTIPQVRLVAILCVIYLVGISITDLYVGNFFNLYMRGAARPVVIGVLFISFLDLTVRAPKGLPFFFAGLVLAGLQNFFYNVDFRAEFAVAGTYRDVAYRYTPLVLAGAFFGGYLLSRVSIVVTGLCYITTGAVFAQYGSRTSGILLLVSGFVFVFYKYFQARGMHRRAKVSLIAYLKYGVVGVVLITGALYAYIYSAPRGLLGERVQSKFENQSQSALGATPIGVLLTGRYHILSNTLMMMEKPILGHGSWPVEGPYIVEALSLLGEQMNEQAMYQSTFGRGTGHSIILGGGSNHGLIGLCYWGLLFFFSVKLLIYYLRFETRYSILMVPLLIQLCIMMWLTPLGTYDRIVIPLALAHYCLLFGLDKNFMLPRLKRSQLLIQTGANQQQSPVYGGPAIRTSKHF